MIDRLIQAALIARALAVIAAAVAAAWWLCAGPIAPSLPGLTAVACLAWLVLVDLRWAPDAQWDDDGRLDRDLTRARLGAGRERLCAPPMGDGDE